MRLAHSVAIDHAETSAYGPRIQPQHPAWQRRGCSRRWPVNQRGIERPP
jgi:hypothetical protein